MTRPKQTRDEVSVFRCFAAECPAAIDLESVESLPPPAPDIVCRLTESGEEVAFELVEIIDRDWANLTSAQSREQDYLQTAYAGADPKTRDAIDGRFSDALVLLAFQRSATAVQRRQACALVLRQLLQLQDGFLGEWQPPAKSTLAASVRVISVRRGSFKGPIFDVEAVSSVADPTIERISEKWSKSYSGVRPIELLAFYRLQPLLPPSHWQAGLEAFLETVWTTGPFRRLWLFDLATRRIVYCSHRRV